MKQTDLVANGTSTLYVEEGDKFLNLRLAMSNGGMEGINMVDGESKELLLEKFKQQVPIAPYDT